MKRTLCLAATLFLVAAHLPAQDKTPDTVSLRLTDAPLSKALLAAGLESETDAGTETTLSVYARNVPRESYLDVLRRGMQLVSAAPAAGALLTDARDGETLSMEELAGFRRLVINGRNLLAEAIQDRLRDVGTENPETEAWLRHRLRLATGDAAITGAGGDGFLGVRLASSGSKKVDEMAPEVHRAFESWDGHGAFVADVLPETGAARSGLLPGDVIVGVNGIWVDTTCTLRRTLTRARLDQEVELDVLRDGTLRKEWAVIHPK